MKLPDKQVPELPDKQVPDKQEDENIIRNVSKHTLTFTDKNGLMNKSLGFIYTFVHYLLIFIIAVIFSFNTNIVHLCVVLCVVSLDAFSVVILHGCPLTMLEQKYKHTNSSEERCNNLKNSKIVYKCEHEYEKTIELLINIWSLIAGKCLLLILFNMFHIKLKNVHNIYE